MKWLILVNGGIAGETTDTDEAQRLAQSVLESYRLQAEQTGGAIYPRTVHLVCVTDEWERDVIGTKWEKK